MEWLHFSDFHFGRKISPQDEAMGELVDYIRRDLEGTPGNVDAVFLVGDLAYSGQASEYQRFERDFLVPLREIPSIRGAKIYAVPGNHDVDCEANTPITWEGIKPRNQQIFFCENEEGQRARTSRTIVFKNYWDFIERNKLISPNPYQEVSLLCNESEFPFDILAINTSFFSDKDDGTGEANTPCPLIALRERLRGGRRQRPLLILGHHPVSSFLAEHQKPFISLLVDNQAFYLHGHEHDPKVSHNANGTVRTLGFGATYIAPLGESAHAPYQNSFARCRVSDRLHLRGYSWDHLVGRWEDATRIQYSPCITADSYDGKSVLLRIPLLSDMVHDGAGQQILQNIPRKAPLPKSIVPISPPSEGVWRSFLGLSDTAAQYYREDAVPTVQPTKEADGKFEFLIEQHEKRDLLVCIPGTTHILSSKEIESYNTRLDTDDYRSVIVISLGSISKDAREMYLRLKAKKPIEVLVNQELTEKWRRLVSTKQADILSACDAGKDTANVLIDDDAVYLLLVQAAPAASFSIVNTAGDIIAAMHSVVARLRENNLAFAKMPYNGEPIGVSHKVAVDEFDEDKYLKQCFAENNAIKYAALANVGLRFSDFSLDDIYIDASACEVAEGKARRLDAQLDDHLAAYPASEKLKAQIKERLIEQVNADERHETSQAREFCQKFGAVLLTGDPGSGKTCFVKSEILAYCRRSIAAPPKVGGTTDEWHALHIPIMVPLAQAAAETDIASESLLNIASRLLERRGFHFPYDTMHRLLNQGRLALFFDGLDEVVSVEKRALVVQHINEIVSKCLPLGNRVVVTSRPAAVNVVNLLPTLRQLELQGLTHNEIRTLANRILSLKLSETSEGLVIDEKELRRSDSATVNKLLQDCIEKPGVARFATNPLLLTLLVMIYANSGAPSAKRHRIYEEAVRTLAAVRGRQAGHDPVSVQDLKERLSAIALSVYRKESGFLPTRAEVSQIVCAVMERRSGTPVPKKDADRFIQKVAESTGLIVIGADDGKGDEAAIVTFMHHSFMEYFAAVGLSRELESADVASLVTQPRWIEILTLLAGIIGESDNIAPVLARFIGDGARYGDVDARHLIFALDCALECEIPSEAATRLLSTAITKCVEAGPAKTDPWVRSEIGQRLSQLILACGITSFEHIISSLVRSGDADVSAAAISLASYACNGEIRSDDIIKALDECCSRVDESIRCAICEAASRVEWFRTPSVMQVVALCLKKSNRCKRAALDAILEIPGLAAVHWPEIISALDESTPSLRRAASKAAIQAGLDGDLASLDESKKNFVANALQYMCESGIGHEYPSSKIRQDTIERLLGSENTQDRLIGIQMIPALQSTGDIIYRKLIGMLSDDGDHQEMTAALRALRSSPDARVLFTVGDLKRVAKLCETGTADVRRASIQLLGCFGADQHAVRALIAHNLSALASDEYEAVLTALGHAQILQEDIIPIIESEVGLHLRESVKMNESYIIEMCSLLDATRNLGKNCKDEISSAIRKLITDFKQDERVKRAALRAYPAIAIPTSHVVEFLTKLFKSPPASMNAELAQTLCSFTKNCRQSVDYVITCVDSMSDLRDAATSLHRILSAKEATADKEYVVTELRNGINEVTQLIVTFEEFIKPH